MADRFVVETLDHDPLATAFAQLRSEVRQELIAPGPGAVRRAVRRRRTRRLVVRAAAAVVLAVGLGVAVLPGRAAQTPTMDPPVSTQPDRRAEALRILGFRSDPGVPWVYSANVPSALTHDFGTADSPYAAGTYEADVACVGSGQITVGWAGPGVGQPAVIHCDGGFDHQLLHPTAAGVLRLSVTPDAAAAGRAWIAVQLTDPDIVVAEQAVNQSSTGELLGGGSQVYLDQTPGYGRVDYHSTPGRYRLVVGCVGAGVVTVTLTVGDRVGTTAVTCSRSDPTVSSVTVSTDLPETKYEVTLEPHSVDRATAIAYQVRAI
jgi:hypothetical protein